MTGPSIDDQRRAAGLTGPMPPPLSQVAEVKPERGHGRGKTPPPDKTDVGLRGVPVIGHGAGAIAGSAPGGEIGAGKRLEQAGKDIIESRMRAARERLKQGPKPPTTETCG